VNNKILFLAYYFPPLGMGGTQRVAKWSKYLSRAGWEVTVVTVKPVIYYAQDESLLEELRGVKIIRAGSLDPARLFYLLGKKSAPSQARQRGLGNLLYWFLLPDSRILWAPFALWRAWREIRKEKIPFVLTSGPPHSAHLVGYILSRVLNVRWVADFRDTWLLDENTQAPTRLHRSLQRKLERLITRNAHALTAVSQGLLKKLEQTGARKTGTSFFLPNGYDPEDFLVSTTERHERFELAFGGSISAYTIPQTFLAGFKHFVETAQATPVEVRLNFVGADLTGEFVQWVREYEMEAYLNWRGYVSHEEAVASFQEADVLVYIVTAGVSDTIIPSKTFEYLAAKKPVLAIGEQIEGMRILLEHAACRYCAFNAVDDIARSLLAFYAEFHRRTLPEPRQSAERFSRAFQAEQLAALLRGEPAR
jgi:glycosyltransferase involved in cell wall biosynthesis